MGENTERTEAPPGPGPPSGPGPPPGPGPPSGPGPRTARQRRPTGAPPPLPHPFTISTTAWLVLAVLIVACAFLFSAHTPWLGLDDRANAWFLRLLAEVRTPWLTDLAEGIKAAGGGWGVTAVGLSVVVLTMVFRRWRHLLVFLGALFFLEIVGQWIYFGLSRPRPYGITIIGSWGGYSTPSPPVVVLTVFLMGAVYCLVVPGPAAAPLRQDGGGRAGRGVLPGPAVPGRRSPRRRALRRRARGRDTGHGVPLLHPERDLPGRLPPGPGCSRRCQRPARRRDPAGHTRPARADRARGQAGRPGVVGRLDAAAAARRRRAGRVRLRQAVHQGPRSRRSLVQAVADHPLRLPGRRAPVPDRATAGRIRGLRAAAAARRRDPHGPAVRDRGDHSRARVHGGHGVLRRGRRDRSGRRRATR